jgi:hypothetical protein
MNFPYQVAVKFIIKKIEKGGGLEDMEDFLWVCQKARWSVWEDGLAGKSK